MSDFLNLGLNEYCQTNLLRIFCTERVALGVALSSRVLVKHVTRSSGESEPIDFLKKNPTMIVLVCLVVGVEAGYTGMCPDGGLALTPSLCVIYLPLCFLVSFAHRLLFSVSPNVPASVPARRACIISHIQPDPG